MEFHVGAWCLTQLGMSTAYAGMHILLLACGEWWLQRWRGQIQVWPYGPKAKCIKIYWLKINNWSRINLMRLLRSKSNLNHVVDFLMALVSAPILPRWEKLDPVECGSISLWWRSSRSGSMRCSSSRVIQVSSDSDRPRHLTRYRW